LHIKIPQGIDEGAALRVAGHGLPAEEPGAPAGDLIVRVFSAPDSRFTRHGADLWRDENIDAADAVLGKKLRVPTLHGPVQVKIPPGTQSEDVLRLRNKGLPKYRQAGRGDVNLRMHIRIPRDPTPQERALYEQLKRLHESTKKT
jgi:DnaJ-class molecular chaperone